MRVLIGSDEARPVVEHLANHLRARGHEAEIAPLASWGPMATSVAIRVAAREFDQGIVCCFTGTGASIAANKVAGIRAALCGDAATARGARTWNDANVLALGLRLLSEPLATEILDAWLGAAYDGTEEESLTLLRPV